MKINTKVTLNNKDSPAQLSGMDQLRAYQHYLGEFKLRKPMSAPYREDKNPSFCIFYNKVDDSFLWKDHGTGEKGGITDLIARIESISKKLLYAKFKSLTTNQAEQSNQISNFYKRVIKSEKCNITITRQAWQPEDIAYWLSYGISLDVLQAFNVYSIKNYLINDHIYGKWSSDSPLYAYKIFDKFKIYRPLGNKFHKWRSNTSAYDIQGWEYLFANDEVVADISPVKRVIFVTKSLKDIMALRVIGYDAILPSSETTEVPVEVIDQLKSRYSNILFLYDNDETGIAFANKQAQKFNLKAVFLPAYNNCKDCSDYVKKYGLDLARKEIENIIGISLHAI